jgi:hypothetical protein
MHTNRNVVLLIRQVFLFYILKTSISVSDLFVHRFMEIKEFVLIMEMSVAMML